MLKQVNTRRAPEAIGPYSQAIISNGIVYTSGQIAIDPETQLFVDADIEEQADRVFLNLKAVLEEAGSSMDKVIKATIYMTDLKGFQVVNELFESYFKNKPARSTVEVSALPKGALVEVDCIAEI